MGYDPTILPPGFDESALALYLFNGVGWQNLGGTVDPVGNTISVNTSVLAPLALGAGSVTTYDVSAVAVPLVGGVVTGAGPYVDGASVSLVATASAGYVFQNWTEATIEVSTSPSYTFIMHTDRSLEAHFSFVGVGNQVVTTTSLPVNGGTTIGDGGYAPGSTATVTAFPAPGYKFSKWVENDAVVSTTASYTFTVTGDHALTAKFKPVYTLTLVAEPLTAGELEGDPFYEIGELAKLKATPVDGYAFVNWTQNGTLVSTDPNFQFNMTGNRSLVGNFAPGNRIDTSSIPPHAGTTTGAGVHAAGSAVTLVATPEPGYIFLNWTDITAPGVPVSISTHYTFTSSVSQSLVANFDLGPEIAVEHPVGTDLVSGTANVNFGTTTTGGGGVARVFTIRNTGPNPLAISSVGVSGGDVGEFTVDTTGMLTTVAGGVSTTFGVTFIPSVASTRVTTLQILSDDASEATFSIALQGTGEAPHPTAAELDYFRAVAAGSDRVELSWRMLVEMQTLAYIVERRFGNGPWERVSASVIPARGGDLRPQTYRMDDFATGSHDNRSYRLLKVHVTGQQSELAAARVRPAVMASIQRIPSGFRLQFEGIPEQAVVLETSAGVTGPWQRLEGLRLDGRGLGLLDLSPSAPDSSRFFRAFVE